MNERLIADVGGTNVRFAIYDEDRDSMADLAVLDCSAFAGFDEAITHYLTQVGRAQPDKACFAIAAAWSGDEVSMVNLPWQFSASALQQQFGFGRLRVINDFESIALSLPHLNPDQLVRLARGGQTPNQHLAALGPGTGLGGAKLYRRGGVCEAVACEPGHAALGPATAREYELFRLLHEQHGEIYAELLLCGSGLQRIHLGLAQLDGKAVATRSAADISHSAIAGEDALCAETLAMFCALLGSAAGDFVLSNGADGGLYLAGGIVPRFIPFLRDSDFLHRFTHKGALSKKLAKIPVYVITEPNPGLAGAAIASIG